MSRPSQVAAIAALLSLSACPRREPPPAPPRPAAPRPAPAAGAVVRRALGGALSVSDRTGSERPQVVVDARGAVLVAWYEAGSVLVKRWSGSAWEPLGAANQGVAAGPFALTLGPDNTPFLAWAQRTAAQGDAVHAARWTERGWSAMGSNLAQFIEGISVTHLAAAFADGAYTVAFGARRGEGGGLHATRWTGSAWTLAGPPSLTTGDAAVRALAATACADGSTVLAWVESSPSAPPALQVRRWNAQLAHWDVIPRGNAPTVDGDTLSLSLAPARDDEFFIAYGWHLGLHGAARWSAAANDWADLGVPQESLRRSEIDAGPAIASRDGALVYAWRTRGGRLTAARHDGRAWRAVRAELDTPAAADASVALGPQGQVYAAFVDRSEARLRVSVAEVRAAE